MNYPKRLYVILYPNVALIGSQLSPEEFAMHYLSGSVRHYSGKIIFLELDPSFRDPYFDIDGAMEGIVPHEDGRPKATKFISCYRVLEHIDFDKLKSLYLTTSEGHCLELKPGEEIAESSEQKLTIYAEIAPIRMLVLTSHGFKKFGDELSDPSNPKSVPALFYTRLQFDETDFLADFKRSPMMSPPISGIHPSKLRDAIAELKTSKEKEFKGISLDVSLERISYRQIDGGFVLASQDKTKHYPFPDSSEIESSNYKFWRNM